MVQYIRPDNLDFEFLRRGTIPHPLGGIFLIPKEVISDPPPRDDPPLSELSGWEDSLGFFYRFPPCIGHFSASVVTFRLSSPFLALRRCFGGFSGVSKIFLRMLPKIYIFSDPPFSTGGGII